MNRYISLLLLGLALAGLFVGVTGCSSTEPENASSIPWNSPRGWEHGLPSSINQGR